MKKHFFTLLFLFAAFTMFAQKNNLNKPQKIVIDNSKGSTTIWSDDFSDPTTWEISHDEGSADWVIGTTGPTGGYAIPDLNSTTAANGFALFDSDALGGSGGDNQRANLTTKTAIDCSAYANVALSFEGLYRKFKDAVYVKVSTDGTNWTDFELYADIEDNDYSGDNPTYTVVDVSSVAANQSQVWIRFFFSGLDENWGYSWMVDDVKLFSPEKNEIALTNIYLKEFTLTNAPVDLQYQLKNNGYEQLTNIDVKWQVNQEAVQQKNVTDLSIDLAETEWLEISNIFTPTTVGKYDVKIWIDSPNGLTDVDHANDTLTMTMSAMESGSESLLLIEHFTQASCSPCAEQNPALKTLMATGDNEQKLAHIAYHTWWPGTDPMYDFNEDIVRERVGFYDVSGVPAIILNGNELVGYPQDVTQQIIDDQAAKFGIFESSGLVYFDGGKIIVDLDLTSLANFYNSDVYAYAVVVEDKTYTSAPGSNGEKDFPNVAREILPTEAGESLGKPTVDQVFNLDYEYTVPSEVDVNNCEVVVFVQTKFDKSIYLARKYKITTAPTVVFNPADAATTVNTTTEITLTFDQAIRAIDDSEISDLTSYLSLKKDNESGADVAFTASINAEKTVITLVPEAKLDFEQAYYVALMTSVENEANLALTAPVSATFTTGSLTGINKITQQNIKLYPNPASDFMNIESEKNIQAVQVFELSGKLILSVDNIDAKNYNLSVKNLHADLYLLKIKTDDSISTSTVQIIK